MTSFNAPTKVFIKSKNNINKITNNYNTSLIIYAILATITNFIINDKLLAISYTKVLIISLLITIIISYVINIIKKEYSVKKLLKEDYNISIAIIISLFLVDTNIYVQIIAILVTLIIKTCFKKINISASLYGIMVILLYKYFNNAINIPTILISRKNIINIMLDLNYLCPLLSIISFIYLFCSKSIKYALVFSYLITFSICTLLYGIINSNLYFAITELITSGILFLSVYTLADYKMTPTISEGNIIYGIILGITSMILRIIAPSFAIIMPLMIGPVLTTKIDEISPKLKYNKKLYISIILVSLLLASIAIYIIATIYK